MLQRRSHDEPPPALAGIGLRAPHLAEVLATRPAIGWLEVHPENFMGGGPALRALESLRPDYPLSLHGVGLSLGSAGGLDERHLERLATLAARLEPFLVSEHLSWSSVGGVHLNDLLPLPCTEEALELMVRHVDRVQTRLRRRILIENPAAYLRYRHAPIPEPELLARLAQRTGCGLLCDLNNIHVGAANLGFDALAYLDALPAEAIGEFHLAGHQVNSVAGREILIDDHGSPVPAPVWTLYRHALERIGQRPALVEWDSRLPPLSRLLAEAATAADIARDYAERPHARVA